MSKVSSSETAISVQQVSKVFTGSTATPTVALEDVSLDVQTGEFISIVGESGCGKSTLLSIVAGLLAADGGRAYALGSPCAAGRRDIGVMLQTPALMPWYTVFQNVCLPFRIFGELNAANRDRCREVIRMVGLERVADSHPSQLSGGMQQRVSLARLLSFGPKIKLMDEPFGALDEFTRERLNMELMNLPEATDGATVFVTHSIPEAVFLSDRVMIMSARPGRLVGEVEVTLPRPRTPDVVATAEFAAVMKDVRSMLKPGSSDEPTS